MDRPAVTWKTYARRLSLWLALAFALICVVFVAIGTHEMRDGALLARDGVDTIGTVVGRDEVTHRRSNGRTRTTYYLVLDFSDAQGARHTARSGVDRDSYETTRHGETRPLRYVASNPGIVEFDTGSSWRNGAIVTVAGLAFGVAAIISVIAWWRGMAAMRRAASLGPRRDVAVLAHHRAGKKNARHSTMEWQDSAGKSRRTKAIRDDRLVPIGGVLVTYADPETGKAWWDGEF